MERSKTLNGKQWNICLNHYKFRNFLNFAELFSVHYDNLKNKIVFKH